MLNSSSAVLPPSRSPFPSGLHPTLLYDHAVIRNVRSCKEGTSSGNMIEIAPYLNPRYEIGCYLLPTCCVRLGSATTKGARFWAGRENQPPLLPQRPSGWPVNSQNRP